jgi:hypothetical protein
LLPLPLALAPLCGGEGEGDGDGDSDLDSALSLIFSADGLRTTVADVMRSGCSRSQDALRPCRVGTEPATGIGSVDGLQKVTNGIGRVFNFLMRYCQLFNSFQIYRVHWLLIRNNGSYVDTVWINQHTHGMENHPTMVQNSLGTFANCKTHFLLSAKGLMLPLRPIEPIEC